MKTIIFNTDEISFKLGPKSNRPNNINPVKSTDDFKKYDNVAVVFLCIEAIDQKDDASIMVNEILKYSSMVGRQILIVPFVHLTSHPASSDKAMELIQFISNELKSKGILEGTGSFGYHKSVIAKWVTLTHKGGDVVYRDSRYIKGD